MLRSQKLEVIEYKRLWYIKNKAIIRERMHNNYIKNKDSYKIRARKWLQNNKDRRNMLTRTRTQKWRKIILNHYGAYCRCCNETEEKFLCIDHINHGKGNPAPRINNFYLWIIKNGFPDTLQILCHNCNLSKGIYGKCPHQE